MGSCCITQGAQPGVLWHLEGWDGAEGEGELQEGKHVCILMADSRFCVAETNTTLESNYPPVKNELKKNKNF